MSESMNAILIRTTAAVLASVATLVSACATDDSQHEASDSHINSDSDSNIDSDINSDILTGVKALYGLDDSSALERSGTRN
jgi:hypothetical protein